MGDHREEVKSTRREPNRTNSREVGLMCLADAPTNADASTNSGEVGLPYRADASDKWER